MASRFPRRSSISLAWTCLSRYTCDVTQDIAALADRAVGEGRGENETLERRAADVPRGYPCAAAHGYLDRLRRTCPWALHPQPSNMRSAGLRTSAGSRPTPAM